MMVKKERLAKLDHKWETIRQGKDLRQALKKLADLKCKLDDKP